MCAFVFNFFYPACLRIIHVFACLGRLFLCIAEQYSIVWIEHDWFIHSFVDGHLCYFQILTITNQATVNTLLQFVCVCVVVCVYIYSFFLNKYLVVEFVHRLCVCLFFKEISKIFSRWSCSSAFLVSLRADIVGPGRHQSGCLYTIGTLEQGTPLPVRNQATQQ